MLLGHRSTRHTSSKMGKQLLSAIVDLCRISWPHTTQPTPTALLDQALTCCCWGEAAADPQS